MIMTTIHSIHGTRALSHGPDLDDRRGASGQGAGEVLPPVNQVAFSGDIGAAVTAMLLEAGREIRKIARASREAAMQAEETAHARRIEAMRDAATQRVIGGVAAGACTMGGGAATMAAAGFAANERLADRARGAAKSFDGAAAIGRAAFDHEAARFDREAEREERIAKQAGRSIESANEDARDAHDIVRRAVDAYRTYVSGKDDVQRAAIWKA
jgi:hypothetical protein